MDKSELLNGFEIVPSDAVPAITLDNQRRFYINTSARRLMDVKPYERLAVAYNPSAKAIAVVKPAADTGADPEYLTSNFTLDKRFYMSARHFARQYKYDDGKAPYNFVYERGSGKGDAFIFRLADSE